MIVCQEINITTNPIAQAQPRVPSIQLGVLALLTIDIEAKIFPFLRVERVWR